MKPSNRTRQCGLAAAILLGAWWRSGGGLKPVESPSLADDQAEFQKIADQLWGTGIGKGKVYGSSVRCRS
jgi:hypothetical protein